MQETAEPGQGAGAGGGAEPCGGGPAPERCGTYDFESIHVGYRYIIRMYMVYLS